MYDLPSEDPEEPGLPDEFHALQPTLLSQTCRPRRYPVEDCFTAQDLNLYYDPRHTHWYKRPDWFLALGAQRVDRQEGLRLSYVIWQEGITPFLIVELLSPGTEAEDLEQTLRSVEQPPTKWQVYEQVLRVPFYAVYSRQSATFRAFRLGERLYEELELPDGRLWFESLGAGVGVWEGPYEGVAGYWLRWYDETGWIPTPAERAEQERQRAERERQRAEEAIAALERERLQAEQAQRDAVLRLFELGLTVAQVAAALSLPVKRVAQLGDR